MGSKKRSRGEWRASDRRTVRGHADRGGSGCQKPWSTWGKSLPLYLFFNPCHHVIMEP